MKKLLLFFSLIFFATVFSFAQKVENDPAYYETFPDKLTTRVYLSQKFLKFTIPTSTSLPDIEYKAHAKMNLGIGVTYRGFSINAFYGFAFLNKDTAKG